MSERDDPVTIGRRVQQLRAERGLTQRQLAEPAYTPAYISTLEAGRVRPSDGALRHIAERLGIAYDELVTGRPARLATDLRLRLTEAQRTLASGEAERAAEQYAALLAEAEENELTDVAAVALLGLGECALDTGELAAARRFFERTEQALADVPLPARVPALRGRAVSHYLAGELRYAVYLLESTLDELNRGGLHDPDALLLLYASVIGPYMDMGAHARAAQAAEFALALAPQSGDPALVARMHRSVARTLLAEGRINEADASLAKAAELYRTLQLRTELANCHWMRGYVCAQNGELERAEGELRQALTMLCAKRAALYSSQVAVELADVLHRRGRSDEAAALLHDVLSDLSPERGALHSAAAHRLLGIIAEDTRDTEAAEEHYVRALSLLERAGAAGDLADLCRLLGDLLRRTGRVEAALDAYRTGLGHRTAPGTTTLGPAPAQPPL
ncbi:MULTISPECIES: helix-turn-helix domain-containing protein [unclassified Streptomyces]|uniref:helix-turn-helix domain-containing protein n=1 Tax=unclassified Streptomyces TaxID=2593676 RepID=UPI00224EC564|nr:MULTISPECIES: helix-turn-helix domain-containing protein [unclassified Streptomyces]MCX5049663.1 helix-turn-helix domain-containing protein [Streptomyces sp. NBC_00474]MCX5055611.1 helix-turn-helix domain-containing protein [Streptomyces sp. NBC_00452]MCX5247543.1 helix-turn-helix domain-containing protein [Streptomyces sp. NBC_00201]MCX5286676.1 helix-turn-helix domain-containing protein [Streptomyces sp. NBC_00183]